MPKLAIVVEYQIKPGMHAAFDAHIRQHAARTLAEEPGCERFDVLQPTDAAGEPDPSRMMLFELYRDAAAFEAHKANPRMKQVGEVAGPMLDLRRLTICDAG